MHQEASCLDPLPWGDHHHHPVVLLLLLLPAAGLRPWARAPRMLLLRPAKALLPLLRVALLLLQVPQSRCLLRVLLPWLLRGLLLPLQLYLAARALLLLLLLLQQGPAQGPGPCQARVLLLPGCWETPLGCLGQTPSTAAVVAEGRMTATQVRGGCSRGM
jgi:hypothetical protein